MDTQKLVRKLKQELKRNPKKTGLLALGLVVAAYFWAPLIAGWIGSDEKPPAARAKQEVPSENIEIVAATPAAAAPTSSEPENSWRETLAQIESDPQMRSAQLADAGRDPFEVALAVLLEQQAEQATVEETEYEVAPQNLVVSPQSAGLVLTGTVISSRGGWAQINNEEFQVGQLIDLQQGGTPSAVDETASENLFKLEEIHTTHVVLSRGTREYELELDRPALPAHSRFVIADGAGTPE